ncbi:hypothetical protein [Terracoccus luteus]|uniref:Uncharacterized protein n=1 Tax=Terracoccus luteus TaxID=53356 RepID=A0A839PW25_9MICO|nr:hypothetical protein [Terracoccus luteus]MBB2984982.1 hypothetical protein [Terracoccus luteus]MCP2170634.1 hypothetical protein [Terracoccus luteus]
MGWFSRTKSRGLGRTAPLRSDGPQMEIDRKAVVEHFREFVDTREGVEAYVEPATSVTTTTVVLIAWDGEWTRRAVGTPQDAFQLSKKLGVPAYDVNQTGYPNRMREYNSRKRRDDQRAQARAQGRDNPLRRRNEA